MICRSQRSAKSAACNNENVVGVSSRRCLPRRVADFTSGEEFHSVKCNRYPPISSQRFSRYSWVLLPEPSVPSTTISAPGYARLGTGFPGCVSVDLPGSVRGSFCVMSRFSINLFARSDPATQRIPALLQMHYNTPRHNWQSGLTASSESGNFDAQELLRVLPELSDEQSQVSREPAQTVIEFGIRKQFADGSRIVVQPCGSTREVIAGFLQLGIQGIIRHQFAQGPLAGPNIADQGVATRYCLLRFVIQRRIVKQLSDSSLPGAHIRQNHVHTVQSLVHFVVHFVRSHQFPKRALSRLNVAKHHVAFGQNAVQVIVSLVVGQQLP